MDWEIQVNGNVNDAAQFDVVTSAVMTNYIDKSGTDNEADPPSDGQLENTVHNNDIEQPGCVNINDFNQFETIDEAIASTSEVWTKASVNNDDPDEDVFYIEPKDLWPAPKTFEINGLVKKENDRFSGDLPFGTKVSMRFVQSVYRTHLF